MRYPQTRMRIPQIENEDILKIIWGYPQLNTSKWGYFFCFEVSSFTFEVSSFAFEDTSICCRSGAPLNRSLINLFTSPPDCHSAISGCRIWTQHSELLGNVWIRDRQAHAHPRWWTSGRDGCYSRIQLWQSFMWIMILLVSFVFGDFIKPDFICQYWISDCE